MTVGNGDSYFATKAEVCLPGITADIGKFHLAGPYEVIFQPRPDPIACMLLSKRPFMASGYYIDGNVSSEYRDIGPLSFMPAGASMYQRSAGVPVHIVRCAIESKRFEAVANLGRHLERHELSACLDMHGTRLAEIMSRLAQEIEAPGFASGVLVESLALGLMVEIARYLRQTGEQKLPTATALAPWQLRRINQYLNEVDGAPTVSDLARQCGVSRSHLSRLFKVSTKMTVHDYVVDVRVKRAKAYLVDTDLPLKEISSRLGFSRPARFSQAFRQSVGESPRAYRQQFRNL
jgi:AraC family transcriptional regulator